jgi:hypothetical protein
MIRPALMTLGLLAAACAKPAPTSEPYSADALGEAPRLPSPRAGSYARAPQRPQDPVVRAVVEGRTWDASLAGAAAGLALAAADGSGGFSRRELREQSWQAGYPWPVLALGVWKADEKAKPPPGVTSWVRGQPADRDLGIVRARGQGLDTWVALAGRVQIDLGVIPRELSLGHALRLPPHAGARWRASDGTGAIYEGDLAGGAAIALDSAGEWLVHIYDEGGDLARFPVYINQKAPKVGVLPVLDKPVNTANEARERAWQLLDIVREVYGSRPIKRDPILGEAADRARDADQRALRDVAVRYARVPERAVGWYCEAPTVEDCIDQLLWDPTTRAPFVDPGPWAAGLSVRFGAGTVAIFGVTAGD